MRVFIFLSVLLLAACGGGSDNEPESAPVAGPVVAPSQAPGSDALPASGFYVGYFTYKGVNHWTEAMLTADGWLYIHTFSYPGWTSSSGPVLFVAKVDPADLGQWTSIRAIGENCQSDSSIGHFGCIGEPPDPARDTVEARITSAGKGLLEGEIAVTLSGFASLVLPFSLNAPTLNYIDLPASLVTVQGMYRDPDPQFTGQTGMVITIDGAGNLFFQSPLNGCTGNGALTPYLDGSLNAYRVELLLENCTGAFQYLNGQLEGIATRDAGYWWGPSGRGPDLYIWLASLESVSPQAALTIYGARL